MYTNQEPVMPIAPTTTPTGEPVGVIPAHVAVVEPVIAPVIGTRRTAIATRRRYAFDSVIVGIVGLAAAIIGLLAVTRTGIHSPMNTPIVHVVGFTHTETLGLIETGIGILLLISAAATSRSAAIFFGVVLGVGGFIGAIQTTSFKRSLALESGLAWIAVIAAIIVVLVSLFIPRMRTETTTVESV